MKNTLMSYVRILFALLSISVFSSVYAQGTTKPDSVPPKVEKLDEGPEAPISVSKPEPVNKAIEKRNNLGQVTEVEVKSGGSHYLLRPNPEIGNNPKGTVEGDGNRPAQWKILEFGAKKESKERTEPEPLPVLPPAPTQATSASSVK